MLRASDSDREHIAERLRNATAEGRLLASELEERLTAAFSARTYGELDSLVSDLPLVRARARTGLGVRLALLAAIAMAVVMIVTLVTLVVLGLAGAWVAWMLFAWLFFGRGCRGRYARGSRWSAAGMGRARPPRSGPATLL